MGNEQAADQPTREELERQLLEAREQSHEADVRANQLYMTASQAEAERAFGELQARQDEVARLEKELSQRNRPPEPEENILDDLDAESAHAALLAGMGGTGEGQTNDQAEEEARGRNRRTILALAATGSLFALAILAWLAWQQQQQTAAVASPTASALLIARTSPTPTPNPTPTVSPTALLTALPTAILSPSPSATVGPSAGPGPIGSVAVIDFTREGGVCSLAETFTALFDFESLGGVLTLTQLPEEHVTTGTLTQTTPGNGQFSTIGEGDNAGQTYEGVITGTSVSGTHVYTAQGCNDTYTFEGRLYTPLLAAPPLDAPPAGFDFYDRSGLTRQMPIGVPIRISIVGLRDGYVIQDMLPMRVVMTVDDEAPWDFMIDGESPGSCIDASECQGDSPTFAEADWFAPGRQPVLIAYDPGGMLAAVFAPNGIPIDFVPIDR